MNLNEKGFSLIEILAAIVILGVVMVSIITLLPTGYVQITNAGRMSTINHLSQKKLDYLRMLPNPLSSTDLTNGTHPSSGPEWYTMGNDGKYTLRWTVENGPTSQMKKITVEGGYDIYRSNGAAKPASESAYQQKLTYTTYVSQ